MNIVDFNIKELSTEEAKVLLVRLEAKIAKKNEETDASEQDCLK